MKNPKAKQEYNKKYYAKTQNALNSNKRWSYEHTLLVQFAELTDHEISAKINRSVKAIQNKRSKLNHEK